jgi:Streptomyces sporulation and cell division protein, SsgA
VDRRSGLGDEPLDTHRDVTVDLVLTLLSPEPGLEVPARLRYRAADPYAVSLIFGLNSADEAVEWLFSRDLLSVGLTQPAGAGDVRVAPLDAGCEGPLSIELSSPSGSATLLISRPATVDFLLSTYALVRPGHEADQLEFDDAFDAWLYNTG